MAVIKRGIGFTPTERNLAAVADKIFLNLWAYPNLFKSDGKELCDLLVVCGDDVLIFSDKNIAWPKGDDFGLSWSRWYRRAIEESAAQINGAIRYLQEHPDKLFLDAACKEKFPLALPPPARRRLHHIAVALGASEACADYYKKAPGYFPIDPNLKGKSHTDAAIEGFMPFAIGDVQPEGAFVHVFNEPALELLARELDTVTDFARYLTRRERIMRSGHLLPLGGDHDLLGQYLLSGGSDEEHDFTRPRGGEWQKGEKLQIPDGTYAGLAAQPGYKARKEANKVSYAWDNLLGQFTASILAGVTREVRLVTKNTQRPYKYASLENIVCLTGDCSTVSGAIDTDISQQAKRSETDDLQIALQTNNSEALETYLEKYPESQKRSEVLSAIAGLKRSEFKEWALFEIADKHIPYYLKISSIEQIGDRAAVRTKSTIDPESQRGKQYPGADYSDDLSVYDCKQLQFATAETTVVSKSGKMLYHYKWADPQYMNLSIGTT